MMFISGVCIIRPTSIIGIAVPAFISAMVLVHGTTRVGQKCLQRHHNFLCFAGISAILMLLLFSEVYCDYCPCSISRISLRTLTSFRWTKLVERTNTTKS